MDDSRNRRADTPGGNPTAAQFSVDLSRGGRASLSAEGGYKRCAMATGAKQDNTFMTPYGHPHRHNGSRFARESVGLRYVLMRLCDGTFNRH